MAAESLLATLFPADCRLCGAPLVEITRVPVCRECLARIRPLEGATCGVCGDLLPGSQAGELCGRCTGVEPQFVRAAAYGSYDGELRGLIHLLKYSRIRTAGDILGSRLAEVLVAQLEHTGSARVVVVPVPLHRSKQRKRGFNQSEEIARAALRSLAGTPAGARLEFAGEALRRVRATESQTGLTRPQRAENVRGAFELARPELTAAREVMLVDDVLTTGTTASECARILRRGGAARVLVATVARVVRGHEAEAGLEAAEAA